MVALKPQTVHGWLNEVSLKAPVSVEGAAPCINDKCYVMMEAGNCVRKVDHCIKDNCHDMMEAGNCVRRVDHHCVVLSICESVTRRYPLGKIWAMSPQLLLAPPGGEIS